MFHIHSFQSLPIQRSSPLPSSLQFNCTFLILSNSLHHPSQPSTYLQPTFNLQYPTSNIQPPSSNIQPPGSNIQAPISNLKSSTFNLHPSTTFNLVPPLFSSPSLRYLDNKSAANKHAVSGSNNTSCPVWWAAQVPTVHVSRTMKPRAKHRLHIPVTPVAPLHMMVLLASHHLSTATRRVQTRLPKV